MVLSLKHVLKVVSHVWELDRAPRGMVHVTRVNSQPYRRVNSIYILGKGSYSDPVTRVNSQPYRRVNSIYILGKGSYSGPVTRVNSQPYRRVKSFIFHVQVATVVLLPE